jgi:hypothetical protein
MSLDIDTLPTDTIGGSEKIPVSDSGTPKVITPNLMAAYAIDKVEAITAGTAVSGADGVFILQSGALKPVDIDLIAQHAIDTVWGKAAEAAPGGTHVLAVKTGATEKTMTLTVLAEYVRTAIEAAILDASDLSASSALTSADILTVTQGSTAKKTTLAAVSTSIYAALKDYVTALSALASASDNDFLYIVSGGVERKVTVAALRASIGSYAAAPATTTADKIPQWSATQKTLVDGLVLKTAIRGVATADHISVPTEKAVRDLLTSIHQQELSADPANPAEGSHVIWQSDGTGAGDDGDIMVKITAGGVTKTATLIDFSGVA